MPSAARVGDPTGHPGIIDGPGVQTVLIAGLPAAVTGDKHTCGLPPAAGGPHSPTPLGRGSTTVFIGGRSAARVGDLAGCMAPIVAGAPNVFIGG
jgi:uncharacterized Zn-binding protein involved in type VI secretion